jgi:hypothetical protein
LQKIIQARISIPAYNEKQMQISGRFAVGRNLSVLTALGINTTGADGVGDQHHPARTSCGHQRRHLTATADDDVRPQQLQQSSFRFLEEGLAAAPAAPPDPILPGAASYVATTSSSSWRLFTRAADGKSFAGSPG